MKIKRIFILIFLFTCVSAAIGEDKYKLYIKNDPFIKATVLTLNMTHRTLEGPLENFDVTYRREIKNGIKLAATIYMQFYAYNDEPVLETKGYILTDDVSHDVAVNKNYVYAGYYRKLQGEITITPPIEKNILNCAEMMIRVYTGNKEVTLQIADNELGKIKKMLSLDYNTIQENIQKNATSNKK